MLSESLGVQLGSILRAFNDLIHHKFSQYVEYFTSYLNVMSMMKSLPYGEEVLSLLIGILNR